MKCTIKSLIRRTWKNQSGQALPWLTFAFVALLTVGGMSIDMGHAYVAYNRLQACTNASALAAASATYNTSGATVSSQAALYGCGSGGLNVIKGLGTVTTTSTALCLNLLMPPGLPCGTGSPNNAVRVVQTSSVSTYFLRLLGINPIELSTTAMASMQGVAQKWNVAVILDSTASMSSAPDSNCSGYSTRYACALAGIKDMLGGINPCASGYTSCVTSNANFHVSLFMFPNVSTSNVAYEYTCGGTPTNEPYTFPSPSATSYTPITYKPSSGAGWTATYQVTMPATGNADADGYLSDYYVGPQSLNTSSEIVRAINGCMKNPGGEGTYLAGAIYAAQASLLAEQKLNPGTKNAIVVLSDGDMKSSQSQMQPGAPTAGGLYPSYNYECQQAIKAANDAEYAGSRVYAVAYGVTASGCSSDGNRVLGTITYNAPLNVPLSSITPCITMENVASDLNYFYADGSSSGCADKAHSTKKLQDIFSSISASFTNPQLLPKGAK
jgi:Flp pilus assembly protein TadG